MTALCVDDEQCGEGLIPSRLKRVNEGFPQFYRQDVTLRLLTRGRRVCVRVPVPGQVYVARECELPPATEILCIERFSFR